MRTALLLVVIRVLYLVGRSVRRRFRATADATPRVAEAAPSARPATRALVHRAARGVPDGDRRGYANTPVLTTGVATAAAAPRHEIVVCAARWAVHLIGLPAAGGSRAHQRSRVPRRTAARTLVARDEYVLVDRITHHPREASLRTGPLRRLTASRPAAARDEPLTSALSVHVSDPDGIVAELVVPRRKSYCAMIECDGVTIEVSRPKDGDDVSAKVSGAKRTELIAVGVVAHGYHHRSRPCPGIELDLRPARQAAARRPTLWWVAWWAVVVVLVALMVFMTLYASEWADVSQVLSFHLTVLIAWSGIRPERGRSGCGLGPSRRPPSGARGASRRGEEAELGERGQ